MAKKKTQEKPATNPKTAVGAQKVNLALIPPSASYHEAKAFEDGMRKYGPYNWRETEVEVMTYIAAMYRHLGAFLDGEDYSRDAGVHHMGHIRASAAIIIDAMHVGNLVDNRPKPGKAGELFVIKNGVNK